MSTQAFTCEKTQLFDCTDLKIYVHIYIIPCLEVYISSFRTDSSDCSTICDCYNNQQLYCNMNDYANSIVMDCESVERFMLPTVRARCSLSAY